MLQWSFISGHDCNCHNTDYSGQTQTLSELEFERGIWQAALDGDLAKIKQLAGKNAQTVNSKDQSGYTALHYACRKGNMEIIRYLVEAGANVNEKTRAGKVTPLQRAAYSGQLETVKYLLGIIKIVDKFDPRGQLQSRLVVITNFS